MDVLKLKAAEILKGTKPEDIFTLDDFDHEYKSLRSKWHPDKNHEANAKEVFQHIVHLATIAKARIEDGCWGGRTSIKFTTSKGKTFRFKYKKEHQFELGKMYIGDNTLMYVLNKDNKDLFDAGVKTIKSIRYPDNKLKAQFEQFLPKIKLEDGQTDIGSVLVIEKPAGTILLYDLIQHEKMIDPKHVAWITSSLYNISVFFEYIGIVHNSLLPMTVFVDTKNHGVHVLGGWWYSTNANAKLKALPSDLMRVLPVSIMKDKKALTKYDRQAIKGIAIACLGDPSMVGSKLLSKKDIPSMLLRWFRSPSQSTAIEEYKGWSDTLNKCYGERKFIEYKIDSDNFYN